MEDRNSFGLYDRAIPPSRERLVELSQEEFERQMDEGAFLMGHDEAVKHGFLHPDYEPDTVLTGIEGE